MRMSMGIVLIVFLSRADGAVSRGKTDCAPESPGRRLGEVL